jgi:hypothetical protein
MTTKLKQTARADTPKEVNLEHSMRLLSSDPPLPKPAAEGELKEKVGIWLFLVVSLFLIYLVMHPTSKA